jgi:septal ring factor EnvC (AmiA/AmiB activator)
MVKQGPVFHVPYFAEDPMEIPTSPKQEEMYVATISEAKELVIETLNDLRREFEAREEITEKVLHGPAISMTKHQLELKVKNLTKNNEELKQEIEEYKVLDRHIKKENTQLKENNCRLQGEHDEVSAKMKFFLRLVQYT